MFIDQPSETTLDRIPNSILVYDDNDAIGKDASQRLMTAPNIKSFAFVGITRCWSNERGDAFMRELWRRGRNELRSSRHHKKWPCRNVVLSDYWYAFSAIYASSDFRNGTA